MLPNHIIKLNTVKHLFLVGILYDVIGGINKNRQNMKSRNTV